MNLEKIQISSISTLKSGSIQGKETQKVPIQDNHSTLNPFHRLISSIDTKKGKSPRKAIVKYFDTQIDCELFWAFQHHLYGRVEEFEIEIEMWGEVKEQQRQWELDHKPGAGEFSQCGTRGECVSTRKSPNLADRFLGALSNDTLDLFNGSWRGHFN